MLPGSDAAGSAAATGSVAFSADAAKVKASADAKVLVQSVKTQNAIRTQRALELNAVGRFEEASRLMHRNASFAGEVLGGYDASFSEDAAAAEELREESSWNTSNASSLGGSLGAERRKKFKTRSTQIETQQSTVQEGL